MKWTPAPRLCVCPGGTELRAAAGSRRKPAPQGALGPSADLPPQPFSGRSVRVTAPRSAWGPASPSILSTYSVWVRSGRVTRSSWCSCGRPAVSGNAPVSSRGSPSPSPMLPHRLPVPATAVLTPFPLLAVIMSIFSPSLCGPAQVCHYRKIRKTQRKAAREERRDKKL